MKSFRLLRWSGCVLSSRIRPFRLPHRFLLPTTFRHAQSSAAAPIRPFDDTEPPTDGDVVAPSSADSGDAAAPKRRKFSRAPLPSPPPSRASISTRLAALHARLALPSRLPINTLARCLIDPSADTHPDYNNSSLSILGNDLLGYFTSEAVLARYPRLPTEVIFSAVSAYVGPKTLATITKEWGVETVHTPGGEVDPGLLQFARREAGNALSRAGVPIKEAEDASEPISATRPNPEQMLRGWRRGVSSRTMYEDATGETIPQRADAESSEAGQLSTGVKTTYEAAAASFIRALVGALYLHTGLRATKNFYNAHFLSRHLDVSALFSFRQPTRDLAKLCAREGFDPPVARILSETGRKSRHPVFVVGVFSGREKLGEGSGGSLDEARFRAAVGALKGWYLYSPLKWKVPSDAIGQPEGEWEPLMVDGGEVLV